MGMFMNHDLVTEGAALGRGQEGRPPPILLLGRRPPKRSSMIYAWALEHARLRECFTLRVCPLRVNPYVRIHIIRVQAVQAVHARDS